MNAPRRLLEQGRTPLEIRLLQSAKGDGPPPGALERAMAAVGVGGAIGAGAAAPAMAVRSSNSLTKWLFELLTWALIGAASGAFFMGEASRDLRVSVEQGAPPPAAAATGEADQPPNTIGAPAQPPGVEGESGAPELAGDFGSGPPGATRTGASSRAAPKAQAQATKRRPTLAEEVALLDSARKALATGDTNAALSALAFHKKRFTEGSLTPEAMVLRVEALIARGERKAASAIARDFLTAYPNDPHAGHMRALLHSLEEPARAESP